MVQVVEAAGAAAVEEDVVVEAAVVVAAAGLEHFETSIRRSRTAASSIRAGTRR